MAIVVKPLRAVNGNHSLLGSYGGQVDRKKDVESGTRPSSDAGWDGRPLRASHCLCLASKQWHTASDRRLLV